MIPIFEEVSQVDESRVRLCIRESRPLMARVKLRGFAAQALGVQPIRSHKASII